MSKHTPWPLAKTVLNPGAPKSEQFILARAANGKYIVEPAQQKARSYFAIDAGIFLKDAYSDFPVEAKVALRKNLQARAAIAKAEGRS